MLSPSHFYLIFFDQFLNAQLKGLPFLIKVANLLLQSSDSPLMLSNDGILIFLH